MKKLIYGTAMMVFMAAALCGCGGNDKGADGTASQTEVNDVVDVDAASLAQAILDGGEFKDSLAPMDSEVGISRVYGLEADKIAESAFYINSNATAEEIAVVKVNDEAYAETVKSAFDKRITDQKSACEDYLPDEIPKLDSAVVYTSGEYVVFCVSCDSDKVNEIIKDKLK